MSFSISFCFDDEIRVECNSFGTFIQDRRGGKHEVPSWVHGEMRSLHHAFNGGQLEVRLREALLAMVP